MDQNLFQPPIPGVGSAAVCSGCAHPSNKWQKLACLGPCALSSPVSGAAKGHRQQLLAFQSAQLHN